MSELHKGRGFFRLPARELLKAISSEKAIKFHSNMPIPENLKFIAIKDNWERESVLIFVESKKLPFTGEHIPCLGDLTVGR